MRRGDLVACNLAFIDCKLPGSTLKENYSIIGAGVTQSDDQVVNLPEPHGFAIGAAAMPNGVTNNLHVHYTAEVFMIFRGEWLFRWGRDGKDGEIVGREGDIVSMPTWMFRGFTNIGPDNGWVFTALGRDETGGVIWDPAILRGAAEHGLFLSRDNVLIDTAAGAAKPDNAELIRPLSEQAMAGLRRVSRDEMLARVTAADERAWHEPALLDGVLRGHSAALAPVIGPGITEHRAATSKVANPHGFSIEWLRIDPGQTLGPFRLGVIQVLIVKDGAIEVAMGRRANTSRVTAEAWGTVSTPAGIWRTLRCAGDTAALAVLVTAGDARAVIEWYKGIVAAALAAGTGIDPNGYLAPADLLPYAPEPASA